MNIQLSEIDEERFGIRVARVSSISGHDLPAIMEFCDAEQVKLLIARCQADDLRVVQSMEKVGFLLMDSQVTYRCDLLKPIPSASVVTRPVRPDEAETVAALSAKSFRGYGGHYHADERLERARCDEVYSSWAARSCVSREVADEVLVAEREDQLGGFVTLKLKASEGEVPLYGVASAFHGQGIGGGLITAALYWFLERKIETVTISTQITNIHSQKVLLRLGFEPSRYFYTFHKWFDS